MIKHQLHCIPILADNYVWLLETPKKQVIVVDPGEADAVINYLSANQLTPTAILLTHRHRDHVDGVIDLQKHFRHLPAFGPSEIDLPITKISTQTSITLADITFDIIAVPGHTLGHLAYYSKPYLFSGDTLFSAGCGRIFEGSYEQMYHSLGKLKALPDDTSICAAHEYTVSNLKFAHHLVPEDRDIALYYQDAQQQSMTLPSKLSVERKINLFLRCDENNLKKIFNINNDLDLFKFFRSQKDSF